jgi:hypothetical protein
MTLTPPTTTPPSGQPVTFVVAVAPTLPYATAPSPTGAVTLIIDGVGRATGTLVNGSATIVFTPTARTFGPGPHTVAVAYPGDDNFTPNSQSITFVAPALPRLKAKLKQVNKKEFEVQVFADGEPLMKKALLVPGSAKMPPRVEFKDINHNGVKDLEITYVKGGVQKRFAWDGFSAARLS